VTYKKFDKQLFEENDKIARECAKTYFTSLGYTIEDNPDIYGPDLILTSGEVKCFIECEIKHNWSGEIFQFDTIQFPQRKAKFAISHGVIFFMINSMKTKALVVSGDVLMKSPLVEVPNRYIQKGELFFQVPLKSAKFVSL